MALTFRARLTLWYVATLACLLALTAAGLIYALDRIAQKKFDASLWMVGATEAENVAARLQARGLDRPDADTISDTRYRELLGYGEGPLEKYVTVVDDSRRVADYTSDLPAPLPVDDDLLTRSLAGEVVYQTVAVGGVGRLRVVYMPVRGRAVARPFVVVVGLPERFVAGEVRSFDIMVALALASIILLTAASALLLAERAIRPVEEIAAAAEAVNARNLKERLPAPRTHDQLGRLVTVFNRMLARLDAAFEAQRRFTSRAAHELRTPLTILKGEAQVALVRRRTVEEYEALLRSSLEEIDKLVEIIDDLLLLARYEGGEADVPREPVALREVVRLVAEQLRPYAVRKGIELSVEAEEAHVEGDANALERMACKLLENAVFYTPRGGHVRARLARDGGRVALTVEDTGIGIATEELSRVFDRFYRAPAARAVRPEGSGIGLSMAAAIAHLHGAAVDVSSERGKGTRFTVSFPPAADRPRVESAGA